MAEHLLALLFALASALALLFAVLWLRALAAYEDRSKAFEDAAADCVRLEGALERAVYLARNLLGMIPREVWLAQGGDDGQGHYEGDYFAERVAIELDELAALFPAEAEDEQHAHAEHLREAREVEQHQEEKHGEAE